MSLVGSLQLSVFSEKGKLLEVKVTTRTVNNCLF